MIVTEYRTVSLELTNDEYKLLQKTTSLISCIEATLDTHHLLTRESENKLENYKNAVIDIMELIDNGIKIREDGSD